MKKLSITDLNKIAGEIIENNQYLNLATVDCEGKPWISTVCYTLDKARNLYFVSLPDSRHSVNIESGKEVAISIYDSQQKWGEGIGLQAEAECEQLGLNESLKAGKLYIKRKYPHGAPNPGIIYKFLKKFLIEKKEYRFYRVSPKKVWINDPNRKTDVRVKVELRL